MPNRTDDLPASLDEVMRAVYRPDLDVPAGVRELATIYGDAYAKTLENPAMTDAALAGYIAGTYGRSRRQAYRDVANVKAVAGNVGRASRAWHEYTALEMIKESFAVARSKEDAKAMVAAANAYVHATRIDKPEPQEVDWGSIAPVAFEPAADVGLLGLDRIADVEGTKAKLAKLFGLKARPTAAVMAEVAEAVELPRRGRPRKGDGASVQES